MDNDFDKYQEFTRTTAIYRPRIEAMVANLSYGEARHKLQDVLEFHYLAGKLNGEAGEVAEQVFKATRDEGGVMSNERVEAIIKEIGDVMWYVSELSSQCGHRLSTVIHKNVVKLESRKERDQLHGSGDDR